MDRHVLVVDDREQKDGPQRIVRADCPGVTDVCRRWLRCHEAGCPPFRCGEDAERLAGVEGAYVSHGVRHAYRGGRGYVPLHWCTVQHHPRLVEAAGALGEVPPGRYPVDHELLPGGVLTLHLLEVRRG